MIWNLYLPPPRGAADVGSCSDGVSVAAAPLAGAPAPRRGHGYPQARGKNKGRARAAEGLRPSVSEVPIREEQTPNPSLACFNLAQDLNQVRIVPGQSSECSELSVEKAPTSASPKLKLDPWMQS